MSIKMLANPPLTLCGIPTQPAVLASPLLSLKAIYSRSLKSAQDVAGTIKDVAQPDLYSADSGQGKTYSDLLIREDITAFIIALPIVAQPEYIEAALSRGKHVLSEKPIAPTVEEAMKLLQYYKKISPGKGGPTWSVAENFRFMPSYTYAAEQIKTLGKMQTFSFRIFFLVTPNNKWIATEWRKTPDYQGGFLLDGGVHFTAAARLMLGAENAPASIIAMTSQVQPYLMPMDTVNALVKAKSGIIGSFLFSVGTNMEGFEFSVACEKGYVAADGRKVTVVRTDGGSKKTEDKKFETNHGVKNEVQAWAEALASGTPNPLQAPEQALADIEMLEAMFKSGQAGSATCNLQLQ